MKWLRRTTALSLRVGGVQYLDVELPGQRGSDCGAHVTEEAVEEQGRFPRSLPPTSAPLVRNPWPDYSDYTLMGHLTGTTTKGWGRGGEDLQEAREEQKQRWQGAEADRDAASVRVAGQTGGDRIHAEFSQTGQPSVWVGWFGGGPLRARGQSVHIAPGKRARGFEEQRHSPRVESHQVLHVKGGADLRDTPPIRWIPSTGDTKSAVVVVLGRVTFKIAVRVEWIKEINS